MKTMKRCRGDRVRMRHQKSPNPLGITGYWGVCATNTALDGLYLGRTRQEARRLIDSINRVRVGTDRPRITLGR